MLCDTIKCQRGWIRQNLQPGGAMHARVLSSVKQIKLSKSWVHWPLGPFLNEENVIRCRVSWFLTRYQMKNRMSYNHGISFTLLCGGKDRKWHLERKRKTVEGGCVCFIHTGQSEPVDTQCEASYWWKEQHLTRVTFNATVCSAVHSRRTFPLLIKQLLVQAVCFPAFSSFLF